MQQTYGELINSSDDTGTIRSAVGLGVDLSTPIGPLSFLYHSL